jgi:FHS family L-fucose permease-like MFS transporter
MALASQDFTADPAVASGESPHVDAPELRLFVMGLFFIFGGITSLNDVIIPKLKELFTLNFTQAMLIQFCFFTAYLVIGIPGAKLVKKIGYMRGAVVGLLTMMVGCLLFIPASQNATYALFLAALFVLASGVVVVQVVANPLISLLGKPETAHSRLTFAQAFNSLGTTVFPIVGSILILGSLASMSADQLSGAELDAYRTAESQAIVNGYLGIAAALAVVAVMVWIFRNKLPHDAVSMAGKELVSFSRYAVGLTLIVAGGIVVIQLHAIAGLLLILLAPAIWLYDNDLLRTRPRFSFGALCIFLYVGAEVSIGSLVVNYLMQPGVMALPEQAAGKLIGLYWGGAMIGRFIGSALMRSVSPGKLLAMVAIGAITLILISINTTGAVSGYSLLAVGLMNSIMFPTIFSLASEKLGSRAADGSGIINVAIFGGAVVPLATGALADLTGSLGLAMLLPAACYAVIAWFGHYARRPASA